MHPAFHPLPIQLLSLEHTFSERIHLWLRFHFNPGGKSVSYPASGAVPEVVDASWELLRVFDKNDARGEPQPSLETEDSRAALRDAVSRNNSTA